MQNYAFRFLLLIVTYQMISNPRAEARRIIVRGSDKVAVAEVVALSVPLGVVVLAVPPAVFPPLLLSFGLLDFIIVPPSFW